MGPLYIYIYQGVLNNGISKIIQPLAIPEKPQPISNFIIYMPVSFMTTPLYSKLYDVLLLMTDLLCVPHCDPELFIAPLVRGMYERISLVVVLRNDF
jgi:hypothetical protein